MTSRSHRTAGIAALFALLISTAAVAGATATPSAPQSKAPVNIDGVEHELTGPGLTEFDVYGSWEYLSGTIFGAPCVLSTPGGDDGFTPVFSGVAEGGQSDAFDGGLFLEVNGLLFNALEGDVVGQQITVRDKLAGISIVRQERALETMPVLRSLITFKNPKAKTKTITATIDSAFGADGDEGTRASSSGDLFFTPADRWFVSSDDPSSNSDAVVTMAVAGKQATTKVRAVPWAPEDDSQAFCDGALVFGYKLRVPGKSKLALLLFTELSGSNGDGIDAASKYNRRKLNSALLIGMSAKVRGRVVNWDLT